MASQASVRYAQKELEQKKVFNPKRFQVRLALDDAPIWVVEQAAGTPPGPRCQAAGVADRTQRLRTDSRAARTSFVSASGCAGIASCVMYAKTLAVTRDRAQ